MSSGFEDEPGSPAVLGGEYTGREDGEGSEQVYIPSQRLEAGADEVNLELRPMQDGRLALLAASKISSGTSCDRRERLLHGHPRAAAET